MNMSAEDIVAGLNPVQRQAVINCQGPLLILAGAGSGKTRVIVHRIAYLIAVGGIAPQAIMAVTFTNKAAQEMRERVREMIGPVAQSMWISTFHSSCARILRNHADLLGFSPKFSIYADKEQIALIKEVSRKLNLSPTMFPVEYLRSVIDDAKNRGVSPDEYAQEAGQVQNPKLRLVADAYRLYQASMKENDALDFGDLLFQTVALFNTHPEILAAYRERFHYILVDEYQDTNEVQYRLISTLAEPRRNLCVVGDDDQSIYSWRGAQIKNILDFESDYPEAKVVRLEENYRSTATILAAANQVIAGNRNRKGKDLWTSNCNGDLVSLFLGANEAEECNYVVKRISTSVRKPGDFAIFYRTNAQSRIFEEGLSRRGIPYVIVGGTKFYDRAEVRDLLAYLKVVNNERDGVSLLRILNVPARGVGKTSIEQLQAYAEAHQLGGWECLERLEAEAVIRGGARKALLDLRDMIVQWRRDQSVCKPSELCARIIAEIGFAEWLQKNNDPVQAQTRGENVAELLNAIELWENEQETPTLAAYLENVALINDDRLTAEEASRVTLMTIHRAKGLEFDEVFLVGLEEGLFPGQRSYEKPELLEEERRLCYVGMTRAREKLHMSACRVRRLYGQLKDSRPSRFLLEIPLALMRREDRNLSSDAKTGILQGRGSGVAKNSFAGVGGAAQRVRIPQKSFRSGLGTAKPGATVKAGEADSFPQGCHVEHAVFGPGVVAGVKGAGEETKLDIIFRDRGRKLLLLKFASLKKLG
ncbi:MAG: UvrD-helicase domain-containing protein [Deltaproteobacteria bacterium]|nr:UvrD-helicase domain-containing protein [Deltaproteobacteria bacterium]